MGRQSEANQPRQGRQKKPPHTNAFCRPRRGLETSVPRPKAHALGYQTPARFAGSALRPVVSLWRRRPASWRASSTAPAGPEVLGAAVLSGSPRGGQPPRSKVPSGSHLAQPIFEQHPAQDDFPFAPASRRGLAEVSDGWKLACEIEGARVHLIRRASRSSSIETSGG